MPVLCSSSLPRFSQLPHKNSLIGMFWALLICAESEGMGRTVNTKYPYSRPEPSHDLSTPIQDFRKVCSCFSAKENQEEPVSRDKVGAGFCSVCLPSDMSCKTVVKPCFPLPVCKLFFSLFDSMFLVFQSPWNS